MPKRIKLVGIRGDSSYESWRVKVKKALQELEIKYDLEDVNDVDDILHFNISAIPALVMNDTVLLEQNKHIPDEEEIKKSIIHFLDRQEFSMKKILVPTDFSTIAQNAFSYARDLSSFLEGQLSVVHVSYPNSQTLNDMQVKSIEDLIAKKMEQVEAFIQKSRPNLSEGLAQKDTFNPQVELGFPKEVLVNTSKSGEYDLILMGTTGSGGILEKVFGSVSSDVSQNAHCPVLLVPPGASFNGINNIMYAGNYTSANRSMLQVINEISNQFDANIHMVHVSKENEFEKNKLGELVLAKLFQKLSPDMEFKMSTVISDHIWEGLDQYAEATNIDLAVIVTQHRNFWEAIRHKSITREMIFHAKTPLLILHLDD